MIYSSSMKTCFISSNCASPSYARGTWQDVPKRAVGGHKRARLRTLAHDSSQTDPQPQQNTLQPTGQPIDSASKMRQLYHKMERLTYRLWDPHLSGVLHAAHVKANQEAAAQRCGLTRPELLSRLEQLTLLLALPAPTVRGGGATYATWDHMSPDTLAELAVSLDAIAVNMVALKTLFPAANIGQLVARRPTMLLPLEFEGTRSALQRISALLPQEQDIVQLFQSFPSLHLDDMAHVLEQEAHQLSKLHNRHLTLSIAMSRLWYMTRVQPPSAQVWAVEEPLAQGAAASERPPRIIFRHRIDMTQRQTEAEGG